MKTKIYLLAFWVCIGFACNSNNPLKKEQPAIITTYNNPIVAKSLPDPTIIKSGNNEFFLYATEDTRNIPIYKSTNLVDWTFIGTAFTEETRPQFEPKGGLWAPDINDINGQYVIYYSMSVWGGEWTCGIGVATADKPSGPFTDRGKLFRSNEIGVQNSIDPFYIEEEDEKFLFWGSFRGIYAIELNTDGLSLMPGAEIEQVASTAFEGTYIHKKNRNYYLFASVGTCCEGRKSTYKLVVGRSQNLFGPYTDKSGKNMMDNGYEVVIDKNERFVGNGHNAEIVTDNGGNDWIIYHAVDVKNPKGRVLMLDKIIWEQGWPNLKTSSPGITNMKSPWFK